MKKVLIPTVVILMAALYFGCAKKKEVIEFDVAYSTDLAIPTLTTGVTYTFTSPDVMTAIGEKLASNGTNADRVGEVYYKDFSLAVKTPSAGNVGFIKWTKFFINAVKQPEQQVAWRYNEGSYTISPTAKSTTLRLNEPNLKNRFMENSVYFKYYLESLTATSPMTLTAMHTIHVKAISE